MRLWELASGKETCQLQPERFAGPLSSFHFSPDGKTLAAAASDNSVRLFDVASGKEIRQFQGHEKPAKSLAFSPDGKILASASSDTTVRLWDTAGGKEIRKLEVGQGNVLSVAFSPDGRTFASAGANRTVLVWRLAEAYGGDPLPAKLDAKQLQDLWADMASDDAAKAYKAVGTLIVNAKDAMPCLKEKLFMPTPERLRSQARCWCWSRSAARRRSNCWRR